MMVRREARTAAHECPGRKRQAIFSKWVRWTALMLAFSSCSLLAADPKSIVLVGGGSTVPLALYKKWKEEYNKLNRPVQMDYVPFGSAEGILQITNGASDFGAGEVLLTPEERSKGNLTELPAALIGIVPIYNL